MHHLALLGDSIFDNKNYVGGAPAVIDHVRKYLPGGWKASLLAVDGSVANNIPGQVKRLPADVTHVALSIGGNDAMDAIPGLEDATPLAMMQALQYLSAIQSTFETVFEQAIKAAKVWDKPILVCTIYDKVPELPPALRTALSLFNDVIVRIAARHGLPLLDLREVCNEPSDYAVSHPIEPSATGGEKIALRLIQAVMRHDFQSKKCQHYC